MRVGRDAGARRSRGVGDDVDEEEGDVEQGRAHAWVPQNGGVQRAAVSQEQY